MPAWPLGFMRLMASRLNAKGVPVSTAERSTSRTMSLTVTVRFSMRGSLTQSRYRFSHSSPQ